MTPITVKTTFLRATHDKDGAYKPFSAHVEAAVTTSIAGSILHMLDSVKPMTIHDIIYECAKYNKENQNDIDFAPFETDYIAVEHALNVLVDNDMATRNDHTPPIQMSPS
jgi:hypothetical protein